MEAVCIFSIPSSGMKTKGFSKAGRFEHKNQGLSGALQDFAVKKYKKKETLGSTVISLFNHKK